MSTVLNRPGSISRLAAMTMCTCGCLVFRWIAAIQGADPPASRPIWAIAARVRDFRSRPSARSGDRTKRYAARGCFPALPCCIDREMWARRARRSRSPQLPRGPKSRPLGAVRSRRVMYRVRPSSRLSFATSACWSLNCTYRRNPPSRFAEPAGTYLTDRMQRSVIKAVPGRCVNAPPQDAALLERSLRSSGCQRPIGPSERPSPPRAKRSR